MVTAGGAPVAGAEIVVAGRTHATDRRGEARIDVVPGAIELTVAKEGFVPVTITVTVAGEQQQAITIEVLDAEEIDEKLMMTPGDVVMMLNEMGGMRVQATSPSLGAASVRIQGMRGRYTRFLSDRSEERR